MKSIEKSKQSEKGDKKPDNKNPAPPVAKTQIKKVESEKIDLNFSRKDIQGKTATIQNL